MKKPRAPTLQERYWAIEKRVNLTVISADSRLSPCPACGESRLIFNAHAFKEALRPIVSLCKDCAILRAGGEALIWVRDEAYLRRKWERDGLLEAPPARPHRGKKAVMTDPGIGGHPE